MTDTKQTKEIVSKDKLLEAGVYFGHKTDKWNPKMKPYIAQVKKGTHIIDIDKTKRTLEFAYSLVKNYAEKGASFVFVGTRKQAKDTIKENALRTNSFYVSERWLGGTLTNSKTIFERVKRMFELEELAEKNYEGYTKKEGILFAKELAKLQKNLTGIKSMRNKPNVMIVADPKADDIAVKEAKKLGVKVIGLVDTNNDPSDVHVAIPANDDSVKSVTLIITILADAIAAAKGGKQLFAFQEDDAIVLPEEPKKEFVKRPFNREGREFNRFRRPYEGGEKREYSSDRPEGERREFRPRPDGEARTFTPRPAGERREFTPRPASHATTGATNSNDLGAKRVFELKEMAKNKGIANYEFMKKDELIKALS